MNWLILVVAGLFEIGWAAYRGGHSFLANSWHSTFNDYQSRIAWCRNESLPAGPAYAVWVGVGAVGTAILGIILLGESATSLRLVSLALIVANIVGLRHKPETVLSKSWLDLRKSDFSKLCG